MENKKIGLCIAYKPNHNNYGTSLLGFATLKLITDLGYDCEIIHYKKKRNYFKLLLKLPLMMISGGFKTLNNGIGVKNNLRKYSHYANGIKERTLAVNKYKDQYFHPKFHTYEGYDALQKGSLNYDLVLVGSDQVWLPLGLYTKFFNLLFVDDHVAKISYASSFGVSSIPFWQKRQTRKYLNRFNAIGVREIRGKEIVESISDKKATVVLDPTLLISNTEWEKELADCNTVTEEDYIFCYFLGNNPSARNAANELKAQTGLKIVFCRHMDEYIEEDEQFGDFAPYDTSPADFANYIRNAKYVCTDSFHCTVFSIHFEKQFLTFYRFASASRNSRNSRIDSLFSLLNLQDRLYKKNINKEISASIDYLAVTDKLEELRKESLEFLTTNIETCLTTK